MTKRAKKLFLIAGILIGMVTACLGLETQHSNHLGWALLFAGTGLTTIGTIYLGMLTLQTRKEPRPGDRSLWLPCLGVLTVSLVTPLEYLFIPQVLPRGDFMQDAGLILVAGGVIFYLLSLHEAEPWKSPADHPGLWPAVRKSLLCPISAGLLLFVFGLGIGYSSLIGLFLLFLLVLPGMVYRMMVIDRKVTR